MTEQTGDVVNVTSPSVFIPVPVRQTKNKHLQECLNKWKAALDSIVVSTVHGSPERLAAQQDFARTFVPDDVSKEDSDYWAQGLADDDEFFLSLQREVSQVREKKVSL
jgi:hypothetical protein